MLNSDDVMMITIKIVTIITAIILLIIQFITRILPKFLTKFLKCYLVLPKYPNDKCENNIRFKIIIAIRLT